MKNVFAQQVCEGPLLLACSCCFSTKVANIWHPKVLIRQAFQFCPEFFLIQMPGCQPHLARNEKKTQLLATSKKIKLMHVDVTIFCAKSDAVCITLGVQSWVCLVKRSKSAGHFPGEFLRAALMWFATFEKLAVDDVEKYVEAPARNKRTKYSCITE